MPDQPPSPTDSTRRGRPRSETAGAHAAIMDTVHALLQEKSVRDLTMEEVARRAKVGKPTLYKWWPTKAALVLAMFNERFSSMIETPDATTVEAAMRGRVLHTIGQFNGLIGKVMADLIAEGQSEPEVLRELYERHLHPRREYAIAEIEKAKANGEFKADTDAGLLLDGIFGAIYLRLLVRHAPLTQEFGDELMDQALSGIRVKT